MFNFFSIPRAWQILRRRRFWRLSCSDVEAISRRRRCPKDTMVWVWLCGTSCEQEQNFLLAYRPKMKANVCTACRRPRSFFPDYQPIACTPVGCKPVTRIRDHFEMFGSLFTTIPNAWSHKSGTYLWIMIQSSNPAWTSPVLTVLYYFGTRRLGSFSWIFEFSSKFNCGECGLCGLICAFVSYCETFPRSGY